MREELVTFETAKLAKEKGFDELVLNHYSQESVLNQHIMFQDDISNSEAEAFEYSAPTQSFLQRWLREEHGIIVFITISALSGEFCAFIESPKQHAINVYQHENWEEALESGLYKALELLK